MTPRCRSAIPLLFVTALSCRGDVSAPELGLRVLEEGGSPTLAARVEVGNLGERAIGPIEITSEQVRFGGSKLPGVAALVLPHEIPVLEPGESRQVRVELDSATLPAPGRYAVRLRAQTAGASVGADVRLELRAQRVTATALSLDPPTTVRQGDVADLGLVAVDQTGQPLADAVVSWRVEPADAGLVVGGLFVGYAPGEVKVVATSGTVADSAILTVTSRDAPPVTLTEIGSGPVVERFTSDLWVQGDYAYTGTWGTRLVDGVRSIGDRLNVWSIADPRAPVLVAEVVADARTVNDVKISTDGSLGVISREHSTDGLNGISLLDLSDPEQPTEITRYTAGLASGVHNLWIDGDYLYVVADGVGQGLRILDISDPTSPVEVASFYAGESILHDVYVRDGLAFLSHWNAGLIILDVGNGIAGGSPATPVEVSRIRTAGGQTHNAWYWPEAGYVFVGEEDFGTPGRLHVVDVSELWHPREVASYAVSGATPHNIWVDEERGILYAAWYERGVRALDVSGALLGDLAAQGRELGASTYAGLDLGGCTASQATCAWAPQLHRGLIYVSDMNTGLHVLEPGLPRGAPASLVDPPAALHP